TSFLRICKLHRPYASTRKTARMTYWTTVNFVCGIFSSRPSIPCYGLSLVQQNAAKFSFCWKPYLEYPIFIYSAVSESSQSGYGRITFFLQSRAERGIPITTATLGLRMEWIAWIRSLALI